MCDGLMAMDCVWYRMCVSSAANRWQLIGRIEFSNNVESIEWIDGGHFYVSVREDNYLHHIQLDGLKELEQLNTNEFGDDHVSFNVLDMAVSPAGGKAILLATDHHRVILMQTGSRHQLRNFYNVQNDGYRYADDENRSAAYGAACQLATHSFSVASLLSRVCVLSTPRLAWSPCGKYAYVTCQDKCVAVLDMTSGQTVHRITGHEINVRDVSVQPFTNQLLSCSFDKTCRVWTTEVE
jgi:WD40 repeat protein